MTAFSRARLEFADLLSWVGGGFHLILRDGVYAVAAIGDAAWVTVVSLNNAGRRVRGEVRFGPCKLPALYPNSMAPKLSDQAIRNLKASNALHRI